MATAMWAKSAVGTNLGFAKELGRILKSWREIFQSAFQRNQISRKPNVQQVDTFQTNAKGKCLFRFQPILTPRCGKTLQSQIFQSVISRTTYQSIASQLRRQAAVKLSSSSTRNFRNMPIMSLIGVTLGVNLNTIMDDGSERMMSKMQENFRGYRCETEPLEKLPTCLDDLLINETSIANGCEGAVYKAKVKVDQAIQVDGVKSDAEYDLALKAVFNYGAESNAHSILQELEREIVPLRPEGFQLDTLLSQRVGRLPPHPNIVDMPGIFVDDMLVTEEGLNKFPAAMPHKLDPERFYGHNKTLYLVMRRRSSHLRDYLSMTQVSMAMRCQILAQLLEGVSHLSQHGVAHRDLKADNILVDCPRDGGCPRVEICDFGCCLAEENQKMQVAYPSRDMYLGGNAWLMAPEISLAVPGPDSILDYSKSDLWAVGALAYEVLGLDNPFYPGKGNNPRPRLDSRTYQMGDLPALPDDVPKPLKKLVKALLSREPSKRPKASVAAAVAQMVALTGSTQQATAGSEGFTRRAADTLWEDRASPCIALHQNGQKRAGQASCSKLRVHRQHARHRPRLYWSVSKLPSSNLPLPGGVCVPARDRRWLNWILTQGLGLSCQLALGDQSRSWSMDEVMNFLFLSRLTYADFKEAMTFF